MAGKLDNNIEMIPKENITPNTSSADLRRLAFPWALACNMFPMSGLLIILGILGYGDFAAEVGIVQGATLAVFLAFSANARNLILGADDYSPVKHLFFIRLGLILPLGLLAYFLSIKLVQMEISVAALLIIRRGAEWFAELQISERERAGDQGFAWRFIFLQTISFVLLVLAFAFHHTFLYKACFLFWGITPLLQLPEFVKRTIFMKVSDQFNLSSFLPHLGSSWVIAISVYVFRVMIVLLVGKSIAGLLFSAFATGGMVNSVYTYALGPSLISFDNPRTQQKINWLTVITVLSLFVAGGLTILSSFYLPARAPLLMAMGFSLIGGGVMLVAQRKRIQILQIKKDSSFVPDIIINILLIASVPPIYFLAGTQGLYAIFLWSACLSFFFYYLSYDDKSGPLAGLLRRLMAFFALGAERHTLQFLVLMIFFFPLFFQLSGNIFNSPELIFDSEGLLAVVPFPLAVIACFMGIALLLDYRQVTLSATIIFTFFLSLILPSMLIAGDLNSALLDKLIMVVQIIVPMFALLLGQSYREPAEDRLRFEAIFLYILAVIIPAELLYTYLDKTTILSSRIGLFSLYQHLQYLPVIFVGMYFLAVNSDANSRVLRVLKIGLAPFIGLYAAASISALTMALVLVACLLTWWFRGRRNLAIILIVFSCMVMMIGYSWLIRNDGNVRGKYYADHVAGHLVDSEYPAMNNIKERIVFWQKYGRGVLDSPRSFFLGHAKRPDRKKFPSAHNYYLDLIYNYGFFSLVPLIFLIIHTTGGLWRSWRNSRNLSRILPLGLLVLFLVMVDNSFKVGLRQPYSGMITFFLWGALLRRLPEKKSIDITT